MTLIFRNLIAAVIFVFGSLFNVVFAQEISEDSDFSGEYRLAPGDVVSVTVFGEPDISVSSMRVPLSGVYNYPLIGEVHLIGKSITDLASDLESRLKSGYLSDPKVSVNIVSYRPVVVTGAIDHAGAIEYQEGMTLRILAALTQVNISAANLDSITIQRQLQEIEADGLDMMIQPGDIVSFAAADVSSDDYYIYGEVNNPGKYEFEQGMTVEIAIITAGGYSRFASKRNIRLRRHGEESTQKVKLNELLQPGDIITVKKRWF